MEFVETPEKTYIRNTDDFVAIFSKNPDETLGLIAASLNKRSVVIPLDTSLSGIRLSQCLETVNCKKLIADDNLPSDFNYNGRIIDIRKNNSFKRTEFSINAIRSIFLNITSESGRKTDILFTSGSAKSPKAVLHTLGNHYYSALGLVNNIKFTKGDKWLVVLPFHHISGFSLIFRAVLTGAEIAVKRKDEEIYEVLKRETPSHISLVPHQLQKLLNNGKNIDILKKMKAVLVGGARMPANLIEQSYKTGLNLYVSYGSTEMCSTISCTRNKDSLKHLKTSGSVLDFRLVKITEKNNIMVKGQTLFAGYLKKDKTSGIYVKKTLDSQGYFDSGDLGYIDEEKYLHVTGRKDYIFKYKAEKILPEEIEKVFLNIEGIEEAIVVPYEINEYELVPVIFIKTVHKQKKTLKDIQEIIKKELPFFKHPRFYLKWPLPENNLKFSRKDLKKIADKIIKQGKKEFFW